MVKYELITLGTDLGTSLVLKAHRRDTAQVGPSRLWNTATSSGDGYEINYSYSTGTNRGSGMVDTVLNGTGDYQTLQVGDDYRAQEFPDGATSTAATYYLRINKS